MSLMANQPDPRRSDSPNFGEDEPSALSRSRCPTCGRPLALDETTLAGFLRARREERGWSLREVAAKTQGAISCPYLSQVELGRINDISARKLWALATVYGCDPAQLMGLAAL